MWKFLWVLFFLLHKNTIVNKNLYIHYQYFIDEVVNKQQHIYKTFKCEDSIIYCIQMIYLEIAVAVAYVKNRL